MAGVIPGDDLGNYEIAMRWGLDSFALHQVRNSVAARGTGRSHG